ncbi:hypothetical protein BDR07DRAFT_1408046, partial [Suillus spraguei]
MRRFSIRACHFMDAYEKGLNGKQASSVGIEEVQGHRVLPDSILRDLDNVCD